MKRSLLLLILLFPVGANADLRECSPYETILQHSPCYGLEPGTIIDHCYAWQTDCTVAEPTPEPTHEPVETPEATPEPTVEPTPVVTPTPELPPDPTPEPTPEPTPILCACSSEDWWCSEDLRCAGTGTVSWAEVYAPEELSPLGFIQPWRDHWYHAKKKLEQCGCD